ncbi:hypothetical protein KAZ92_00665 [Candidatus Gracilibacteria bacterium]|nr:hypothetical protein [Candidatus Gracilibacteria bacterium]
MKTFLRAFHSSLALSLVEKKFVFQHGGPEAPQPAPESIPAPKEAKDKPVDGKEKRAEALKNAAKCRLDVKSGVERERQYKPLKRYEGHKLGKVDPEARKDLPKVDIKFEGRAVGGVSAAPYDAAKERTADEWKEWSDLAKEFDALNTKCLIVSNFASMKTGDATNVMSALQLLTVGAKKAGEFDPAAFKESLDRTFGADTVYGAHGVFNLLLAFKRAKEMVPDDADPTRILYDLRVASGNAPKSRFSQLDQKKTPEEMAAEKGKGKKPSEDAKPSEPEKIPPQIKLSEKPKESLEDAAAAAEKVVETAAAEYRKMYGFPISVIKGKDQLGNPVFTMSVDVGDGVKRSINLRVVQEATGIKYSLMDRPTRNSPMFPTLKDGEQAFRAAAEKILDGYKKSYESGREKVSENISAQLDAFFGPEQYLHAVNASVDSHKITNTQRIGGENGVDFSDAQYAFYKKGGEVIYAYSHPAEKYVDLYVTSTENSDPKSRLIKLNLGSVSFGDLGSQVDKDAFAVKLLKYTDARPLRPSTKSE